MVIRGMVYDIAIPTLNRTGRMIQMSLAAQFIEEDLESEAPGEIRQGLSESLRNILIQLVVFKRIGSLSCLILREYQHV